MQNEYCIVCKVVKEDSYYVIEYPDFQDCKTLAVKEEEILAVANQFIAAKIIDMERRNEVIPVPKLFAEGCIYLNIYMPLYRKAMKTEYVKKTVSVPKWLLDIAKNCDVNYSKAFVRGLRLELGMSEDELN